MTAERDLPTTLAGTIFLEGLAQGPWKSEEEFRAFAAPYIRSIERQARADLAARIEERVEGMDGRPSRHEYSPYDEALVSRAAVLAIVREEADMDYVAKLRSGEVPPPRAVTNPEATR